MPNVDFERRLIANRLASTFNSPDLKRKLLQVKAKLDYQDEEIVRVNFLDTFRPELWCLEGLARQLEPLPGRRYGLTLIEALRKVPVHFMNIPEGKSVWVLYVQVDPHLDIVDDAYFLKKVRDQIGFSSRENIEATIIRKTPSSIAIEAVNNEESETLSPLTLAAGTNTLLIITQDQRIGAWLLFAFLCNYLDRGYKPLGFAASVVEKEVVLSDRLSEARTPFVGGKGAYVVAERSGADITSGVGDIASGVGGLGIEVFARWSPFVISNQQIVDTFGFQPDPERFSTTLQSQHYQTHYNKAEQTWSISPPIFRFDLIHPIDILEDYLVVTGYDFAEIQPRIPVGAGEERGRASSLGARSRVLGSPTSPTNGSQTKRSMLEERLVSYMQVYGARQTVGLLLDSYENVVKRMCHDAPERLIHLVNAANKNREYAVDSSLVPLLRNAVHPSAPVPPSVFFLFTETLFLDEESPSLKVREGDASVPTPLNSTPAPTVLSPARPENHEQHVAHSRWKMGILLVGTDHPFNNAHTLLDALCYHLRLPYLLKRSDNHALISGRQITVSVAETPIGQFGEVHPEVLTRWELFYPTSFIELDLDSITELWDNNNTR